MSLLRASALNSLRVTLLAALLCGSASAADVIAGAATETPATCAAVNDKGERVCPVCPDGDDGAKQGSKCEGSLRGKMLDRSLTLDHSAAPNTEQGKGDAAAPATPSLPFRISVDGEPVDASPGAGADAQRRTDVASAALDIQIRYDSLNQARMLNSYAWPGVVLRGAPVHLTAYANYAFWISRGEIRLFARGSSTQQKPLAVVPLKPGEIVEFTPPAEAPGEMIYVYRVYDNKGRFDETGQKPLRLVTEAPAQAEKPDRLEREMLAAYGVSSLKLRNIPVTGGAVTANGRNLRAGQTVRFMGLAVPVDPMGSFAARQILPAGPHHVEVVIDGIDGKSLSFTRDLSIADKDWFYVAIGDLTAGHNSISGPIALVTGDNDDAKTTYVDGRGALYLKGKISGEYLLTVAADTQEQPLKSLFSNMDSKDPRFLLRNLDPNLYYPVYGDDSTTVLDTPSQGKFFVRLERGESQIMWGNFLTRFTGTEFANFSRGLYGANLHWVSDDTTRYGEKRTSVDGFAAQPGTLQSRDEYRGTGGSLYYLRNQDVTQGSEQVWIEVRDYISGLVVSTQQLVQQQDYQIDYLQGRVVLTQALSSTANASTLVRTGGLSGDPVYLVVTYEYVPGLATIKDLAIGGRASYWLNDNLRIGATSYHQGGSGEDQVLQDVDATLRYAPGTYVKTEIARSRGPGSGALSSINGGFSFVQTVTEDVSAGAKRVEAAVDLAEVTDGGKGRISTYWQERDAGFSGPGQLAPTDSVTQRGAQFSIPLSPTSTLSGKVDDNVSDELTTHAAEVNYTQKLAPNWGLGLGVRGQRTETPLTAADGVTGENGGRVDGIILLGYRSNPDKPLPSITGAMGAPTPKPPAAPAAPGAAGTAGNADPAGTPATPAAPVTANAAPGAAPTNGQPGAAPGQQQPGPAPQMSGSAGMQGQRMNQWDYYAFVQPTLMHDGDVADNNRVGVGGSQQINDRFRVGAEVSGGSGGAGGSVLGGYQVTDRSNVYLSYALTTDSTDESIFGRNGAFTTGTRYRYDDSTSIFAEERATFGAGASSLVNSFGLDLASNDRWSNGIKFERGTVADPTLGALSRNAIAYSTNYHFDRIKYSGALEYRDETASGVRTTSWLMKNSLGYQVDTDWRFLGRLNFATSQATQPGDVDPNYVEGVLSFAYRPVANDRWNMLFKYTYLANTPPSAQAASATVAPLAANTAVLVGSVFGQLGPTGSLADYAQKSNVLSVDTIYDVSRWVSLGVKYAIRIGSAEYIEDNTGWYNSSAQLFVLRADVHVVREWDAVVEVRDLVERTAADARAGFLLGIYRHFPEHVKVGVGYNFTSYSDNLTDLSYKSHGFFVNMLTTF
jgi:hypothetical protein